MRWSASNKWWKSRIFPPKKLQIISRVVREAVARTFYFVFLCILTVLKKLLCPYSRKLMQEQATNSFFFIIQRINLCGYLYKFIANVIEILMLSLTYQRLHQRHNVLKFYERKLTPIRFWQHHTHSTYEHAYTR